MDRFADLRVHVEFDGRPYWSWRCVYCGEHGTTNDIDTINELVDLTAIHAGCAELLLSGAADEAKLEAWASARLTNADDPNRDYWYPR
jgi:hypothetical protein